MNLRHLETFYWAARLGSFAKSAQKMNATQSAVSMRIQEVESRLSTVLFDRSQRIARLTPDGVRLLPYAEEILTAYQRLIDETLTDSSSVSGYIRLGVTENVAISWLGAMMKQLKRDFPKIQVELEVGVSYALEEQLLARKLDMLLAACELPASKFRSTPLQSLDIRWMCNPNLEGVPDLLTPASLANLPVISVTREWQARGSHLRWFTENNIHFRNVTICNTFRTAASMVIEGLGIAQLPVRLFQEELRKDMLRILPCEPEIPTLQIFAIRPIEDDNPAFKAVEDAAREASSAH
ncbi:MAG: LysR family transcriptional regulator [Rhizobiaceae bacterium]|nr:LysR family transcriptional regulator [Rhizobiaceae bacterium]